MNNTCARVGVVAVLAALLSACASTPAPEAKLVVPSISRVGELQKLSQQPAVVVNLKTVGAQEKWLLLERSDEAAFVGHAFDGLRAAQGMSQGPIERVPFNEVALVYYATPPHPFVSEVAPEHASFPSLPAPGVAEQGASCAELDVELARAEAIRWYARDQGGAPFTASEIAKTHAKNFAKDTGIAVLAFVALAGGGGSGCWSKCGDSSPNVLSTEDWQWAVTAAQRRVILLLELKQAKHCPLGVVSGMDGGDLGVLEQIAGTRRQHAAGLVDDVVLSAQETSWLDKLNPAPLGPRDQSGRVVECGEGAVQKFDHVVWELDMNSWMSSGSANTLRGTIVLTEKSLIVQLPSDERTSTGPVVHIPYNDMASVEMQSKMGMHWAVVRRLNGHAAVFWFQHRLSIERKRTEAVAALIKSRIPAKSAAEAGK